MKKPSQLGLNIGNRLLYPILNGGPTNIYSYIFLHEYKLFAYNQKQDIFSLLTQMSSHNKKPMDQKAASRIQVRIMHLKFFPNHFEKNSSTVCPGQEERRQRLQGLLRLKGPVGSCQERKQQQRKKLRQFLHLLYSNKMLYFLQGKKKN